MSSVIKSRGGVSRLPLSAVRVRFPALTVEGEPAALPPGEPAEIAAYYSPTAEEIAAQTLSDAEARAQACLAEAQSKARQIEEAAREAGYRDGFSRGSADAEAQWTERFARLEEGMNSLQAERDAFCESIEPELVRLSIEIARKVLKRELKQSPEAVLSIAKVALRRIKETEIKLWVHPDDVEIVRSARAALLEAAGGAAELEIYSDRRVEPGGCVVETPNGNLDACPETQLDVLEDLMHREYGGDADDAPDA